ncbi:MAG: DegT/DnrJ/EryC1/StrS family aminotransferase [Planctomycetaceae bacterium]|jgi:dTDP-4-amino-4,6-dideoxygalactose transaminase|nr:DegT/DnrJ/EryC1/StrS family aminotransferase [Planctomycetaceae bacterium]
MDKDYQNKFSHLYYRGRVGAAALLHALGISNGDEVAIQAFTCMAIPEFVYALGCKPVYIDIEENGFNMSPESLETKLTEKTKAIVVQHTFGIPAQIDRIMTIANKHHIPVIEDCCHTLTSTYDDKLLGTFGAGAFYSFEWGKPIIAGVGGAAIANTPELDKKMKQDYSNFTLPSFIKQMKLELQYRAFTFLYRPTWFWYVRSMFRLFSRFKIIEGNYNEIGQELWGNGEFATIMSAKTQKRLHKKLLSLTQITKHAQYIAEEYTNKIQNTNTNVLLPTIPPKSGVVFARYPIRVKNKNDILQKARANNIELANWYDTPIHPITINQANCVGYESGTCPNAEIRCHEIVSLPVNLSVNQNFINKITRLFQS